MSQVTLTLPEDAARALHVSPDKVGDELRIAAAMKLYEMGRLSTGKAAEIAGMSRTMFLSRLADYGVTFSYPTEELRRDAGLD